MSAVPTTRGAAGLAMLELLITASIVAVALLAISFVFPVAISTIGVGGDETAATAVGQAFIEKIQNVVLPR